MFQVDTLRFLKGVNMKHKYTITLRITDLEEGKIDFSTHIRPGEHTLEGPEDITPAVAIGQFAAEYISDLIKGSREMDEKTSELILTDHFNNK
jgi:hypothetical protein